MMDRTLLTERVAALNERLKTIKIKEADLKMEQGKLEDDVRALVSEATGRTDGQVNIVEILHGALIAAQ